MQTIDPSLRSEIHQFVDDFFPSESEENGVLLADGFEKAFIGVGSAYYNAPCAVYDYEKCLTVLMENGCDYEEAIEYFEFNVIGAYVGKQTPIFVRVFPEKE